MSIKSRIERIEKNLPEPEFKTRVHREGLDGPLPEDWGENENILYILVSIGEE